MAQSTNPSTPSPAPQGGIAARLLALMTTIRALLQFFRTAPPSDPLTAAQEQQVQQMRAFIPRLARACADMMDFAATLFQGFPFTGGDLRAQEEEVRIIEEFLVFINGAVAQITAYLTAAKSRLAQRTLMAADQIKTYQQLPVPPAGVDPQLINEVVQPVEEILRQANAALMKTKNTHVQLVQQGEQKTFEVQADLQAAQLESQVLRGQPLTSGAIAAAAPKPPMMKKARSANNKKKAPVKGKAGKAPAKGKVPAKKKPTKLG